MVRVIENLEEFQGVLKDAGSKLVVVDFTATWCGPCKMIAPVFEDMSKQYPDVLFIKVDVDDAQDVSTFCSVSCMPTFQFYKDGKKVDEFSGANKEKLAEFVVRLK
ncbi:thioredoxin-like [Hyperolius riggenbachi]|uniref:thioredoxin-like n=1 Tax=Hyperolius riggenbachi TaxID=752182 RepID=UPI0035A38404